MKTAATFPVVDGVRLRRAGRLRPDRGGRHDRHARPRLGLHQLGRREDLPPRRSRRR
ncbi:hypothetical protein ACU686_31200 [Yinghuangia aomiensis]